MDPTQKSKTPHPDRTMIGSIECITISDDESDDEVAFVSVSSANRPSEAEAVAMTTACHHRYT